MGKKKILSKGGATLYFHFQKLAELLGLASHLFCNKSMEFLSVGDCGVQQESNTRKNYILKPQNAIMCTNFVYFCVHHQHIIALFLPRSQAAKHRGPLTFHSMYCVHTWLYLLCSRKYLKKKNLYLNRKLNIIDKCPRGRIYLSLNDFWWWEKPELADKIHREEPVIVFCWLEESLSVHQELLVYKSGTDWSSLM